MIRHLCWWWRERRRYHRLEQQRGDLVTLMQRNGMTVAQAGEQLGLTPDQAFRLWSRT